MAKKTKKTFKSNQTYLIIIIALILAGAGYFGYRSMMATPEINIITPGDGGGAYKKNYKKPSNNTKPNQPKPFPTSKTATDNPNP